MAPNACKLFYLVLLFAFITQGYGQCNLETISLQQSKTGVMYQNKPVWEVKINNNCPVCDFQNVKLSCAGFQSVEPVPIAVWIQSGDICSLNLNPSRIVYSHTGVVFDYAWDTSFDLKIIDGTPLCS